jgi:hypothetical protein
VLLIRFDIRWACVFVWCLLPVLLLLLLLPLLLPAACFRLLLLMLPGPAPAFTRAAIRDLQPACPV